jgi:hypothetical protein
VKESVSPSCLSLIDPVALAALNGYRLPGESQGLHIKYAIHPNSQEGHPYPASLGYHHSVSVSPSFQFSSRSSHVSDLSRSHHQSQSQWPYHHHPPEYASGASDRCHGEVPYTVPGQYPPLVPFPAAPYVSPASTSSSCFSSAGPVSLQESAACIRPSAPMGLSEMNFSRANERRLGGYRPDRDLPLYLPLGSLLERRQREGSRGDRSGSDLTDECEAQGTSTAATSTTTISTSAVTVTAPNQPKYIVRLLGVSPDHDVLSFPFIASLGHVLESSLSSSPPSSISSSPTASSRSRSDDASSQENSISYLLVPKTPAQYQQLSLINNSTIYVDECVITVSRLALPRISLLSSLLLSRLVSSSHCNRFKWIRARFPHPPTPRFSHTFPADFNWSKGQRLRANSFTTGHQSHPFLTCSLDPSAPFDSDSLCRKLSLESSCPSPF